MFKNDTVIDTMELDGEAEANFLIFCVGIVKTLLQDIKNEKYKDKFDVSFQWGGCGCDYFDIFPIANPDASICCGCADGYLGCNAILSGTNGITGEYAKYMEEKPCTIKEVIDFLKELCKELFEDGEIEEILDEEKIKEEFERYGLDRDKKE